MKRIYLIVSLFIIILLMIGCGLREKLLAPPDEYVVPEGALTAECSKDDDIYLFIYKDDGIYQYFINDILQDEDAHDYILEQAYLNNHSVLNYINLEFPNLCTFGVYSEE